MSQPHTKFKSTILRPMQSSSEAIVPVAEQMTLCVFVESLCPPEVNCGKGNSNL